MHENAERIRAFYEAFARRDHAAMASLYAPDVDFSDPAFPGLKGAEVAAMWRMLCEAGKDLVVTSSGYEADDHQGRAYWEARYTLLKGRPPIHNRIEASFRFRDGLVVEHVDRFDMSAWCAMAFGLPGRLFGWGPIPWVLRPLMRRRLKGFMKRRGIA